MPASSASVNDCVLDLGDTLFEILLRLPLLFFFLIHLLLIKLYFLLLNLGWWRGWSRWSRWGLVVGLVLRHLNYFRLFDGHVGKGRHGFALRGIDHLHELLRVLIYSQSNLLVLIVVNRVKMTKEKLPKYEVLIVKSVQLVLGDGELALALSLEKILRRIDLKDSLAASGGLAAANQEAHRLQLFLNIGALLLFGLAEISITGAVKVWDSLLPLCLQPFEQG